MIMRNSHNLGGHYTSFMDMVVPPKRLVHMYVNTKYAIYFTADYQQNERRFEVIAHISTCLMAG